MRKELNKSRYILAAILTIVVFLSGMAVGLIIEKARLIASEDGNLEQRMALSSLQVQQLFLDSHNINSCNSIQDLLESNTNELGQSMENLVKYNKRSIVDREKFETNLRNYFITEMQYFLMSEKMQKTCDTNTVNILYFYTESQESDLQGYILDFIKEKFGDKVLIFSFNANFDKEPMISLLRESYSLKEFPSIVINGKPMQGYTEEDEIAQEICEQIDNASPYCL